MSLPQGYTYQSLPRFDWDNLSINLVTSPVVAANEADCAVQTFNRGGHFFSYNDANKNCWPKDPLLATGRSVLYPNSASTFFEIPGKDFIDMFDMIPQSTDSFSKEGCVDLCRKTTGCVVCTSAGSLCVLKQPKYSGGLTPLSSAGVIYQLPPCVAATICSASQCGTTVTDNCGNPLVCPACETGNIVSLSSASSTPKTVVVVVTATNPVSQLEGKGDSASKPPNMGLIAGVAVGILLLLGIAGLVCWNKRKRLQDSGDDINKRTGSNSSTIPIHYFSRYR
ncbi:hypothetical protein BDR26DRAFT_868985, partial [Obelidium mucronatum]